MTSADPDLLLRPAGADDVPAMARSRVRARRAAPMPDGPRDAELTALLRATEPGDELWVAEVDGGVVGYTRFVHPDSRRVAWLDDLYVDPAHAGQGVGGALLDLVKGRLPRGFGLWVFERNLPARAFYAAHGVLERGHAGPEESPEGEPEVRLQWPGVAVGKQSEVSPSL